MVSCNPYSSGEWLNPQWHLPQNSKESAEITIFHEQLEVESVQINQLEVLLPLDSLVKKPLNVEQKSAQITIFHESLDFPEKNAGDFPSFKRYPFGVRSCHQTFRWYLKWRYSPI